MNFTTYLFDFDGTLADSMPCFSQKMINVLDKKERIEARLSPASIRSFLSFIYAN